MLIWSNIVDEPLLDFPVGHHNDGVRVKEKASSRARGGDEE
jgi:hypothetical protein